MNFDSHLAESSVEDFVSAGSSNELRQPRQPAAMTAEKPFLRWAGGKTRLLASILPFAPTAFGRYFEPFLGSGAMYFALRSRAQGECFIGDLNQELINTWQVVQSSPDAFLKALSPYYGRNSEEDYYVVRAASPSGRIQRAARFFYLNQTSWNSLWRVNKHGVFNVPWGDRPFRGIDEVTLKAISASLVATVIENSDFRDTLPNAAPGDFVYLDPPYLAISDTSKFAGYTEKRFRRSDLFELAELCKDLSERGVYWMLSNRDTAEVRELFSFAKVTRFTTRRSVSAQNRRDIEPVNSPEVIVTGAVYQ
jgi:DNA adenine methylase